MKTFCRFDTHFGIYSERKREAISKAHLSKQEKQKQQQNNQLNTCTRKKRNVDNTIQPKVKRATKQQFRLVSNTKKCLNYKSIFFRTENTIPSFLNARMQLKHETPLWS